MTVPRDVVLDLLPVYLAGEASASTRSLVEEYARSDAEIAAQIRAERLAMLDGLPSAAVPPQLELTALAHTRRLLRIQRWLFGLALAFAAFGCSIEYSTWNGRLHEFHFLIRDYPMLFGGALVCSAGCWVAYAVLRRRIRTAGF